MRIKRDILIIKILFSLLKILIKTSLSLLKIKIKIIFLFLKVLLKKNLNKRIYFDNNKIYFNN